MKYFLPVALFVLLLNSSETTCYAQKIEGVEKYDTTLLTIHSPVKASFYSAVLPGLGQIYNKKYWKVPICYAAIGTCVYLIDWNNKRYQKYKKAFVLRIGDDPANRDEFYPKYNKDQFKSAMDFYRRNRDLSVMCLAGVYILQIIDATVDAYLFDYDVSQDLSMHISPGVIDQNNSTSLGLTCTFNFK